MDKEQKKAYDKDYREKRKEILNKQKYEWDKQNPEKAKLRNRKGFIKYMYKITWEEYLSLVEQSDNKCNICSKDLEVPFIDHDHNTGKVRGILCHHCNTGLGYLKDSIDNLKKAIVYLESFNQ